MMEHTQLLLPDYVLWAALLDVILCSH